MIDYGKSLLKLRVHLDKDQDWVAERLKTSRISVSNWENRVREPNLRNMHKIEMLLTEHNIEPVEAGEGK